MGWNDEEYVQDDHDLWADPLIEDWEDNYDDNDFMDYWVENEVSNTKSAKIIRWWNNMKFKLFCWKGRKELPF